MLHEPYLDVYMCMHVVRIITYVREHARPTLSCAQISNLSIISSLRVRAKTSIFCFPNKEMKFSALVGTVLLFVPALECFLSVPLCPLSPAEKLNFIFESKIEEMFVRLKIFQYSGRHSPIAAVA